MVTGRLALAAFLLPLSQYVVAAPAAARNCENPIPPMPAPVTAMRAIAVEDLVTLRDLGSHAVSSDGGRVVVQLRQADIDSNGYCFAMIVVDRKTRAVTVLDTGGEPVPASPPQSGLRLPIGSVVPSIPQWSPDGRTVAYLRRDGQVTQLWTAQADGGGAKALTHSATDVESFAWSSDGRRLVFTAYSDLLHFKEAADAEGRRGFLYDDRFSPDLSGRPFPRDLAIGLLTADLSDLHVRPATDAEAALVSPPSAGTMSDTGLRAVNDQGGEARTTRSGPLITDMSVRVKNNGKEVLCAYAACQGGVRGLWWAADGREVRFLRGEGWGESEAALYRWVPGLAPPRRVLLTTDRLADCKPSGNDLICVHEASTQPRRIVVVRLDDGRIEPIFDPNPQISGIALQPARRLRWVNNLGFEAFGDLVLPAGHKRGQRHPLLIVQYRSRGFLRGGTGDEYPIQVFAARGFAVLSLERPKDYADSVPTNGRDDWFRASFTDWMDRRSVDSSLEAGIAAAIATGAIDPDRIGITGLSDGGSTVQWSILNGRQYAAASVSALTSQTCFMADIGPARARDFRRWGLLGLTDPKAGAFWRRMSFASQPDGLKTPLLVQVSDGELACALDSFAALKERGRPIEMHVFPGEFHIKNQPTHRLAIYRRNLQWFAFWLQGIKDNVPIDPDQYQRWAKLAPDATEPPP
jgi:dipeptidyl aminopeptidase/acylaminoacyl peptidase